MNQSLTQGRIVGATMAVGFAISVFSNFALQPALQGAAADAPRIGTAIVLGLAAAIGGVLGAALLAARYGREFPLLAWAGFGLAVAQLAAALVELSTVHALRVATESSPEAAAAVRALRQGVHLSALVMAAPGLVLFFALLWRARALPRLLAGAGMAAAVLQGLGVAGPLFGGAVRFELLAPLALAYAASAAWLLWRGLGGYRPPATSSTVPVV